MKKRNDLMLEVADESEENQMPRRKARSKYSEMSIEGTSNNMAIAGNKTAS